MFFTILTLFLGASLVFGVPLEDKPGPRVARRATCGVNVTEDHLYNAEKKFKALKVLPSLFSSTKEASPVEVYWNIVAANRTLEGGWIPKEQIEASMKVLNDDFAEMGLKWKHVGTTWILKKDWFEGLEMGGEEQLVMKTRYRKGDASTLNIYTVGFLTGEDVNLLGYATFPSDYAKNPENDGVVVNSATVPGGSFAPFNRGRTLVHEVGHWLGLYHTFQGGCTSRGDMVSDTPAEKEPAYGCLKRRKTCPGIGYDSVHNLMNYGDDQCIYEFTPGQTARARSQVRAFRGLYF